MPENPTPESPDIQKMLAEVLVRLSSLEQAVVALRAERPSLASLVPYTPPSEEELQDLIHGPRGRPLLEVIEEYEKKYLGG